jgi:GT2 family glycosyltransferase
MKKIAVVILNYKGWLDSLECFESLMSQDYEKFRVILIDNHSQNESVGKFKEYLNGELKIESPYFRHDSKYRKIPFIEYKHESELEINLSEGLLPEAPMNESAILISTSKNLGFSGGNNLGARYADKLGYEYVLILNNDTVIIDKSFLTKLVEPFKLDNSVYMTGPHIINFDDTFDSPFIEDTFMGNVFYLPFLNFFRRQLKAPSIYIDIKSISSHKAVRVFKVSGACMMFKTSKLKLLNYLDENVWLSSEEAILSEKIKIKQGKIVFQPLTTLVHKKARSPRPKSDRYNILKNHYKQREYFYKKYKKYGFFKLSIIKAIVGIRLFITKIKR